MSNEVQGISREARMATWLAVIAFAGWLLWLLAPVLTPFLVSAILAYLGDPVADWLEKHRFSRTMAVVTVFLSIILALLILLLILMPLLEQQMGSLMKRLPAYLEWLQATVLPWLHQSLGIDTTLLDLSSLKAQLVQSLDKVGGVVAGLLSSLKQSSAALFGWLANLLLIPVLTFYLLRDWDLIVARLRELMPRQIEPVVTKLAGEADEVLGGFLRGQFMVMLALGIMYSIGLVVSGLEFSLLIGMMAGLVSFVPYLGVIVGIVVASIAALLQFQDFVHLIPVFIVFGVGQMIEGMLLTPWLVGDRIGMHPVAVIFAVLAGGHLFGFFGVLLALPAAAVIMVLLRHTHDEYLKSALYFD